MNGPWLILIIGNSPDLPPLFEEANGDCEWMVEQTSHFELALNRIRLRPFDLILVDHRTETLGEVDSLKAIRAIRPEAKVILLASDSTPEKVIAAMREHAFSYFARPFKPEAVRDMICHALKLEDWEHGIEILSADPEFLTLRLPCRIATADRLARFLHEIKLDLPEEERVQVAMAFRELLLNAIEHGGKLDPNERVRVSRIRARRTIVYHIQDPGPGFRGNNLKHAAISNPADSPAGHMAVRMELGLRPGGFGMLMAKRLIDEVIYNEQGNEVILIKHLD
jgi:anti-sigma regulatory factor (Ser/Thr protein kinase)/ActR/RegA family two-component response regulator